jgi:hypothetical protein
MKTPPATKGRAFERKNHADLKAYGLPVDLRGQWESHDLVTETLGKQRFIECKDCKRLSFADVDKELDKDNWAVIHKRFRGKRRVTMDFDDWVELWLDAHCGAYPGLEVLSVKFKDEAA